MEDIAAQRAAEKLLAVHQANLRFELGRATRDRAAIGEGHGRDILGHPFHSVAWLATQLASKGVGLKAGQVVMTGSVMRVRAEVRCGSIASLWL